MLSKKAVSLLCVYKKVSMSGAVVDEMDGIRKRFTRNSVSQET